MNRKRKAIIVVTAATIFITTISVIINSVHNKNQNLLKEKAKPAINRVVSDKKSDNKITSEENKYFKKITITSVNEIGQNSIKDNSNNIKIKLENIKSVDCVSDDSITLEKSKSGFEVLVNKKYKENYVYEPYKDKKTVIVLISKKSNPFIYKIALDPGHGGYDVGTNIPSLNLKEKNITLNIAQHMRYYFLYNGFDVVMTRDKDEAVGNARNAKQDTRNRAELANDKKVDLFLSIHLNSFKDSKYNGIASYYYCPNGFEKEERKNLATCVQNSLMEINGWHNRGIVHDRLAVLTYTKMPSVLVEYGFMSNENDRKRMTDEKSVDELCKYTVKGILTYCNIK